jgi:miniconductance mechanosensitive channel
MEMRPSNLSLFRMYVELSLRNNPDVNQELTLLVRYQQSIDKGVPVEYIFFSKKKDANEYEGIKASILEHLWSVLPEFNLVPFQNPTGNDFRSLIKG